MMFNKDDIEIFVFTSNRIETLRDSLLSILNQSVGSLTVTVMDMESTDGTGDLVSQMQKTYSNLHYCWHGTCNILEVFRHAISLTKTKFVMMFNDVDILHPDYVKYALDALNKYPKTSVVSCHYQGWSNPTNDNWEKASRRFDFCTNKRMFANYLYRMQRFSFEPTIYRVDNLKQHKYDMEYYAQFGPIIDKPFVANTMQEDDGAIIFRDKKLFRHRTYIGRYDKAPNYDEIIAFNRFFKHYMDEKFYSKLMFNIVNYKQLRTAYFWGHDFTLSLEEFISLAISKDAGSISAKLCTIPYFGIIFREIAHILRKFFKTQYIRNF